MQIFIKKIKEISLLVALTGAPMCLFAQQADSVNIPVSQSASSIKISGTITDAASGLPLPGISVGVPGFSSSITDDNGRFTVGVPSTASSLTISGEGYQRKEVPVKGRTSITVSLFEESFKSLYDVANLPNQQGKPLNHVVGAVVSVNPEQDKWHTSADSPENYLQGRVAGLNVTRRSGTQGIGASMVLRGYSSLYTTNQPLVVVDGVLYDMNDYGGSLINNHFTNPLNNIDIKDIDNITVIKDAASIYGSKGANGAILITTSHARELATKIDFATYAGVNAAPDNMPVMDAFTYRTYLSDMLLSRGYTDKQLRAQPYMNDDVTAPGYYTYHNLTNWQNETFGRSYNQNYYIRVSGGDNIARYALSMGFLDHSGVVQNSGYNRYNTRFNADLNMTPKLQVSTNLGFTYGEQNLVEQGIANKTNPMYLSLIKAPFLSPNEISNEGILSPNLSGVDIFNVGNPSAVVNKMQALGQNYRFFGSANFVYEFTPSIKASTQFGVTYDKVRQNFFVPRRGILADTLENAVAESRMGSQVQRLFALYNDTRLSFNKTLENVHELNANLGMRYSHNNSESDFGLGFNSATDELRSVGTGSTALRRAGGDIGKWLWVNYYADATYGFLHKYFLSLNLAVDGSSRFGKEAADGINLFDRKFGVFPSVGASWIVSSENFMADVAAVDMLKLRASYGLSGNDDIGNYTARQYYVTQNLLGLQGLVRGNIGNPALQWETRKKLNAGIDLAVLNERLSLSVDVYHNVTDNMLIQEQLSSPAGFEYMYTNNGGMKNNGVDVSLNSRIINTPAFKWDLGLTLSKYRNEITRLPGNELITQFAGGSILTRVGQQANLFYGYKTNGVYSSDAEAAQAGLSTMTPNGEITPFRGGDVRFVDMNGDNLIDQADRVVIGNPTPDFNGMFSSRFAYKRFSLDAFFTFSKGNDIYNYTRRQLESMSGTENQTMAMANRWRANGQVTDVPRASWGDPMGNARFSDRWIEDGSYLRLRTLTLKYDLPLNSKYFKYISVYTTGNNLLTFSNYLGYDPEFSASESIFAQGVDVGLVPQFRSVLFGVRLGL